MINDSFSVNGAGHLTIGGADAVELAQQYGTPLYVMDENAIRRTLQEFRTSIDRFYEGSGLVVYASKAFCCKEMCRIAESEGAGIDVVSGGEICTARAAGFPADRVFFHGNNKTDEELALALDYGVGTVVVDNLPELERLEALCAARGVKQRILLRIKPGVDAHTHDFVRTGQIDSKFGFALETGEALAAARAAIALPHLELRGIHCHIGSQIFEVEPFHHAADIMCGFLGSVKQECGVSLDMLNLGGGFGIKYVSEHDPVPYADYMREVAAAVKTACAVQGVDVPFILIEPGRSVVGPAGATLYTVGAVKDIPKVRTYVSVDGGMTDNPRYALYQSEYEILIASRAGEPKTRRVTLAGKCCETGDLLGEDMFVQDCVPGDLLAVLCTGAYNYSMASNYNRIPRPPVLMVRDGEPRVVVRRESWEDVGGLDI